MREIRFKVYLKKENRFIVDAKYYFCWDFAYIYEYNWWVYNKEYEIESKDICQYTWLRDKNWKEIYEWDIMQFKSKYPIKHQNSMPWKKYNRISNWVVYSEKWWCYLIDTTFENEEVFLWFESNMQWEIIWNIYENPDIMASIANNNI